MESSIPQTESSVNIHEQLRALLAKEGAAYRVIEHEAEGRKQTPTHYEVASGTNTPRTLSPNRERHT